MVLKKRNIILDLDNTLICAEPIEDFPFNQMGIKNRALQYPIYNLDYIYIVFERPNLQNFLDKLFEEYNVSIWTAATKEYALFIINNIICPPGKKRKRKLKYIFWDYHGNISYKHYNHPKNLKLLWEHFKIEQFNQYNTIIIDDYNKVIKKQKDNSIHVKPAFHILKDLKKNRKDTFLNNIFKVINSKFENLEKKK